VLGLDLERGDQRILRIDDDAVRVLTTGGC